MFMAFLQGFGVFCGLRGLRGVCAGLMFMLAGTAMAVDMPQLKLASRALKATSGIVPNSVAGCPDQGGLLDSITVPVSESLDLTLIINAPAPRGGATFNVLSANPAFVAAGDPRQGFIPTLFIPEGARESNSFRLFGLTVGQTTLRLVAVTPGFSSRNFPLGAWDINRSNSGPDQKVLDANDPVKSCRVPGTATLSNDPALLATCGKAVKGVAADGVNPLLLRTASGLAGTACFEIVSSSSLDMGKVLTPLTGTRAASGLQYGTSYYTPPMFYGDTSESRDVEVEFTFTPNIGNGNTSRLRAKFKVVRPPRVLVHGVWSDGDSWNEDKWVPNTAERTSVAANYRATHAASFATNNGRVKEAADRALRLMRSKGFAATQVDVIGHSMGGLLTRQFVASADYKRPDNLDKGDVHRLVTLDTPHLGSSFANLLVALHNQGPVVALRLESTVSSLTGGSAIQGAVCDLAENSTGLAGLNGSTDVRSQAITATGGPAASPGAPGRYWGGATFLHVRSFESALTDQYCAEYFPPVPESPPLCSRYEFYFPQALVNAYRFQEPNDAVVAESSQRGGLAGINFNAYIHHHIPDWLPRVQRGITDGEDVAVRVGEILQGDDNLLAPAFPGVNSSADGAVRTVGDSSSAPANYAAQCGAGGPMRSASSLANGLRRTAVGRSAAAAPDPRVRLVSPAAGSSVALGSPLTAVVELSPPLTKFNTVGVNFVGQQHLQATWIGDLRFSVTLPSTALASGALTLIPDFTDTSGKVTFGAPVVVAVQPGTPPTAIALQQSNFLVAPGALPIELYLKGTVPMGVPAVDTKVNLTQGATGTVYSSSNAGVVSVSPDGLVTIVGPGRASVTARHGALTAVAAFVVEDPANPLPPVSMLGAMSVTRSGFQLDRSSGFYVQTVTLTNSSATAVPGPLYLVVRNLTPGVTLVSKSGITSAIAPVGSPFLSVPLPGEGLSLPAGAKVTFTLKFLNSNRQFINYAADVVVTSVEP